MALNANESTAPDEIHVRSTHSGSDEHSWLTRAFGFSTRKQRLRDNLESLRIEVGLPDVECDEHGQTGNVTQDVSPVDLLADGGQPKSSEEASSDAKDKAFQQPPWREKVRLLIEESRKQLERGSLNSAWHFYHGAYFAPSSEGLPH